MIAQQLQATSPRRRRGLHKGRLDRGAAAVEMALVLPLLLFVLMAMIDFGRAFNAQIQVSQAAREGVRLASLNGTASPLDSTNPFGNDAIKNRVNSAAGALPPFETGSCSAPNTVCTIYCPTAADEASVVVTSEFTWITGISGMSKFFGPGTFPTPSTVQATGVMRCAG